MNPDNITDAKAQTSGALFVAPAGTTLPTDATTTLANTFKQIGYASTDGLSITENRDTVQWDAWEGTDVVRVTNGHTVDVKFKLLEPFAEDAAKLMFGSSHVTVSSGAVSKIEINGDDLPEVVLVAEMLLRNNKKMRAVIGRFQVTSVGEFIFKRGEYIAPEVNGTALKPTNKPKISYFFG